MIAIVIGSLIALLGIPFLIRGWVFTLKPDHRATLKAKERNMRLGLETNMKIWGRKVRRLGFILCTTGGLLIAWGAGAFE